MRLVISNGSRIWGGAEAVAEILARGFQARGHQVVVFCRGGSPLEERLRGDVFCEPILGGFDLNPVTLTRCLLALRRHRTEVIITNTAKDPRWTGVAARSLGIPVVFRQEIDEPFRDRAYYRLLYGWVPAHYIVNGEVTRRTLLNSVDWVQPDRVTVIRNGVDLAPYTATPAAELELPPEAIAIGYVGKIEALKGMRELAAAWPRVAEALPNVHLLLAGTGTLEAEMRAALAGAPRVRWLGFRWDIPAVMRALDLLVLPSHFENAPLVLLEAMAAAVPVVTCEVGTIPEMVEHGSHGFLIPPRDAGALAEALIALGSDAEVRARMGRAARARVEESFTLRQMLAAHEALLLRLIGEARGDRRPREAAAWR